MTDFRNYKEGSTKIDITISQNEFIDENDEWSAEHATDDLSPAKKQRQFCERMLSDIIAW